MNQNVKGFSKLSKEEKINWITNTYFVNPEEAKESIVKYWNSDENLQKLHDEFIENTLTNFYLPYGVAPNFVINGKSYTIPMAIEESSVVAAASKAAKFWGERGGFKATIINTEKIGQVHFLFNGNTEKLITFFNKIKPTFFDDTQEITKNMQKRGGGILAIELRNKTNEIERKVTTTVRNAPKRISASLMCNMSALSKFGVPKGIATIGMTTSSTIDFTRPEKAPPTTKPTAIASRFPLLMKSRNSLKRLVRRTFFIPRKVSPVNLALSENCIVAIDV